jgi:uncharacterized MAPEG superfamily protein
MTQDQRKVALGAASGAASMLASMWLLFHVLPVPNGFATAGDKLGYALRWDALAALPLLVMIGSIGNARFFSEAIDPLRGAEDKRTVINGRVADNTTQQLLLFVVATLALAPRLDAEMLPVLGAAAITFVAARIAFWIGYRIDPLYRAAGFAGTAYLNGGLLVWACWLAVRMG